MRVTLRVQLPRAWLGAGKPRPGGRGRDQAVRRPARRVDCISIKRTSRRPGFSSAGGRGPAPAADFSRLGLGEETVAGLGGVGVTTPTVIQMLAIPKILRGRNVLCAAETGSGKTLAYLAPLISKLREEETTQGVVARLRRPRALLLLPSRDLAAQVLSVAKSLSHTARFRAVGLIGGMKRKYISEALEKPVDVAIATPASLLKFRREEQVKLTDLRYLVIDEADTMFDSSFEATTTSIIKSIKVRSKMPSTLPTCAEGVQVIIVGATLSNKMLRKVETLIPNIKKVSSKGLHRILPNVEQTFYKVRQDEKAVKLLDILQDGSSGVAMVFCNTVPSCDWTAHYLEAHGVSAIKLHSGFSSVNRRNLLREFVNRRAGVLVCTDIASHGIDAPQVDHVVLFDFPNTMADYLHRVGRTGRMGGRGMGKATIFMSHKRDVQVAWKIKDAANKHTTIMNRKVSRRLQLTAMLAQ